MDSDPRVRVIPLCAHMRSQGGSSRLSLAASSGEYFPEVCQVVPYAELLPCLGLHGLLRQSRGDHHDYRRKMCVECTLPMSFVCNLIIFSLDLRDFLIF